MSQTTTNTEPLYNHEFVDMEFHKQALASQRQTIIEEMVKPLMYALRERAVSYQTEHFVAHNGMTKILAAVESKLSESEKQNKELFEEKEKLQQQNADLESTLAGLAKKLGQIGSSSLCSVSYIDREINHLQQQNAEQAKRINQLESGIAKENKRVEQTLGVALGYPWYENDQDNFPGATAADGVCVGEHTPGTIAMEAADKIAEQAKEIERLNNHTVWMATRNRVLAEDRNALKARVETLEAFVRVADASCKLSPSDEAVKQIARTIAALNPQEEKTQ